MALSTTRKKNSHYSPFITPQLVFFFFFQCLLTQLHKEHYKDPVEYTKLQSQSYSVHPQFHKLSRPHMSQQIITPHDHHFLPWLSLRWTHCMPTNHVSSIRMDLCIKFHARFRMRTFYSYMTTKQKFCKKRPLFTNWVALAFA